MKKWLFAGALTAAVFLAYQPAWRGKFIWDDDLHLVKNPVLKAGGLAGAWTPGSYINYWPLTFSLYRLEFEVWGLDPLYFHLVNIALHTVNALLVWRVLVELEVPGAMLAAAIFALHPVNVESVAWITQLKGILAVLFAAATALLYLQFDRVGGRWRYLAALAAFCLSVLAKGMVVTLPVVLLASAWWRRSAIDRRDLARLLPFVLIAAVATGVEVWQQQRLHGSEVVRSDGLSSRAAVAGRAVWFYLGKLVWPFNLCFVYPRWKIDHVDVLAFLSGLLLVILFALALSQRRRWGRPVLMLFVCYVGLLLPALGFVNIYFMKYSLVADHWQYAATIVPCAVFAGAAAWTFRGPVLRPAAYALGLALLAGLAVLTRQQSRMYIDVETLYQTTIDENPDCWMAHFNLGNALRDRREVDQAIAHYRKALKIKPDLVEVRCNLGMALAGRGQVKEVEEAIYQFRKALEIKPDYAAARINLGNALDAAGLFDEAIFHYRKVLEMQPRNADVHYGLGEALVHCGQLDDAISHYRTAVAINPNYFEAHANLGVALARNRQVDEAIDQYRKALKISPDYALAHFNLGLALAGRGQVDEAHEHYQTALGLALAENDADLANRIREQISRLANAPKH